MATIGEITTRTAINSYLKVMQKSITKHFNDATVLLNMVEKQTGREIAGGRSVELPHHVFPNNSLSGVRGDAGQWAKSSVGKRANATVNVYAHNMTGSLGHIAELKTKQDVQSMQSVTEATVEDIKIGFPRQINKYLFLDGRGVLARVDTGAGAITATGFFVDDELVAGGATEFGTHYLEPGQWLTATSDDTLADPDRLSDFQITNVNDTTFAITVEGSTAGLANNDYICVQDGLNNVTNGLLAATNDGSTAPVWGTASYLGINRTAAGNAYWKGNVTDMGGAGTIEDNIITTMTTTAKRSGKVPPIAITTFEVYNQIFIDAKSGSGRQFVANIGKSDGGNRQYGLGFNAIDIATQHGMLTIFGDKDCPKEWMIGFDPKDFKFAQVGEQGWYKGTDGSLFHEVGGTYGLEVNWLWVFNFICTRPQATFQIGDIPVT